MDGKVVMKWLERRQLPVSDERSGEKILIILESAPYYYGMAPGRHKACLGRIVV